MYTCHRNPQKGLVGGEMTGYPCCLADHRFPHSVRHPNYDDILEALLSQGLDSIEERVSLSVGEVGSEAMYELKF
jgi:hypothetical protein